MLKGNRWYLHIVRHAFKQKYELIFPGLSLNVAYEYQYSSGLLFSMRHGILVKCIIDNHSCICTRSKQHFSQAYSNFIISILDSLW